MHRRDKWTESLLDSMIEPEAAVRDGRLFPTAACLDEALGESLVRHFEQSAIARHVLATLAFRTDGMHEAEVCSRRETGSRPKSENASCPLRCCVRP
jgi:hypothetical protein